MSKKVEAQTAYNQQPDISDPQWRKARELLWRKQVSRFHKGEGLSSEYTEAVKLIFMGEADNVPEGTLAYADSLEPLSRPKETLWYLRPLQNEKQWFYSLFILGPYYDYEERAVAAAGQQGLINYRVAEMADIGSPPCAYRAGWGPELALRFSRYLLGERFPFAPYQIDGQQVAPMLSPSVMAFDWLDSLSRWLCFDDAQARSYFHEFEEYFFSVVDYIHPFLYCGKCSHLIGDGGEYMLMVMRLVTNFNRAIADAKKSGNAISEAGLKCRREYHDHLTARVAQLGDDHPFYRFWQETSKFPLHLNHEIHVRQYASPEQEALLAGIERHPLVPTHAIFSTFYIPPWFGFKPQEAADAG